MKAVLIEHIKKYDESFAIRANTSFFFSYPMHFHSQYELTYIIKGAGTRFIGNSIMPFEAGDLVLIGANIPHCWKNYPEYYTNPLKGAVSSVVVQFDYNFLGNGFFELAENFKIKKLFSMAGSGIFFKNYERKIIDKLFRQLQNSEETQRIINLLTILNYLTTCETQEISIGKTSLHWGNDLMRMNKVISFVTNRIGEPITLDEVAAELGMNKTSFCKFFKRNNNKTFIEFVNEMRIGLACANLKLNKYTISEICDLSGFSNFSHFSNMFKKYTQMTPRQYRDCFLNPHISPNPPFNQELPAMVGRQ